MKMFVAILILAAAVNAELVCPTSSRFTWMQSSLSLGSPWSNYTTPNNQCCDATDPGTVIDFNATCTTLYGRSQSTTVFMMDPNNCQKFHMCSPAIEGGFNVHNMTCPDCMFWDDNKLSCIEVDDSCRVSVSVETGTPNDLFTHAPIISCIDFENVDDLSTGGMYVHNNGVYVVKNGDEVAPGFCQEGNNCGFFNSSFLEIPFFSNNYNHLPNLKITFKLFSTDPINRQVVISNDCENNMSGSTGSSLLYAITSGMSMLSDVNADGDANVAMVPVSSSSWQDITIDITNSNLSLWVGSTEFASPHSVTYSGLRESHCPLVIGGLLKNGDTDFFNGYIDNVCFTIDYEQ